MDQPEPPIYRPFALLASISLRSLEVLAGFGWRAVATLVALSGVLAWVALACVGLNVLGARAAEGSR